MRGCGVCEFQPLQTAVGSSRVLPDCSTSRILVTLREKERKNHQQQNVTYAVRRLPHFHRVPLPNHHSILLSFFRTNNKRTLKNQNVSYMLRFADD